MPSGTIPAKPINNFPYEVATFAYDLNVYSELNGY